MKIVSPESEGFSSQKLSLIDDMCRRYIDEQKIAGISAFVSRNDNTVYRKNFGYQDIQNKTNITDDTIFRIYSMTKPVTMTAAMQLYEKKKFGLDDPISEYIPSFKEMRIFTGFENDEVKSKPAKNTITIRHLLTMTSGLSYGFGVIPLDQYYIKKAKEFFNSKQDFSLELFIDQLATLPLAFEPGTQYHYSYSHDVIGRLIEVVSGQKLSVYMKEHIFGPLNMTDTDFFVPEEKMKRLASLYDWKEKKLVRSQSHFFDPFDQPPRVEFGGAGLVSTVEDYAAFCSMLVNKGRFGNKTLLQPETVELMRTNQLSGKAYEFYNRSFKPGYGYGLGVRTLMQPDKAGFKGTPGEFGWDGAAGTWMCVDPAKKIIAVFMIQVFPFNVFGTIEQLRSIIYDAFL